VSMVFGLGPWCIYEYASWTAPPTEKQRSKPHGEGQAGAQHGAPKHPRAVGGETVARAAPSEQHAAPASL